MNNAIDNYFLKEDEPNQSCMLVLREFILDYDPDITLEWKYGMPIFCYHKKMLCYLWTEKKSKEPYLGVVDGNLIEHPLLEKGNRKRMKILRVDPLADLPLEVFREILDEAIRIKREALKLN